MRARAWILVAAFLFLAGGAYTSVLLHRSVPGEEDPEAVLYRLTGGLRVFLVDALWLRMRTHQFEGKESLVLADARTLLALEPDSAGVRAFLHWHLTFNMARKAATEAARAEWFREGLDLMDEGLARDPRSPVLNYELGTTFLIRSRAMESGDSPASELFRAVCFERYGRYPIQLAPIHLERAYRAESDPARLFRLMTALLDAAYYETARESYAAAAPLWRKVLDHVNPWLETAAFENAEDAKTCRRYYEDLEAYCTLLSKVRSGEDSGPGAAERIDALRKRIESNPFHEPWEDRNQR